MTELLTLSGVTRTYEGAETVLALADVTLTVRPGELVTIMGPSGSGKSTLLALAGGLEHPTEGTVSISGRPLADLNARQLAQVRRREVAFVFQQYNLIPLLTVIENVTLPLELDGWSAERCATAGREALAAVEMTDAAELYPERLSGGQQQRVAIARAIAGEPRLILADEPTAALDSVAGESIMRLIRARVDGGAAAIVVTHDARLAALADRVLYLSDGRLQPEASTAVSR